MKKPLLTLLAIFIILEEWLWDFLAVLGHYLIKLLQLERFELWLTQTTPNTALLTFLVPVLLVTPLNIIAIALLVHGLILQGIFLEIIAKLLGTLLVARIFTLTKPQLLTFSLIAAVYHTISRWLRWAHEKIANTSIYRYSHQLKLQAKAFIKQLFA